MMIWESIWAGQELYRKGNSKEMFYNILEKDMKYGIIHKDFKRAEEYVVRKAKKISEEYM